MDDPHRPDGLKASREEAEGQKVKERVAWAFDIVDVSAADPLSYAVKLRRRLPSVEDFAEQLSVMISMLQEEQQRDCSFQLVPYRYGEAGTLDEFVLVAA